MTRKIKWKVFEVKKTAELDLNEFVYTKRIIPFIRKVTKDEILDDLQQAGLLTEQIRRIIED